MRHMNLINPYAIFETVNFEHLIVKTKERSQREGNFNEFLTVRILCILKMSVYANNVLPITRNKIEKLKIILLLNPFKLELIKPTIAIILLKLLQIVQVYKITRW